MKQAKRVASIGCDRDSQPDHVEFESRQPNVIEEYESKLLRVRNEPRVGIDGKNFAGCEVARSGTRRSTWGGLRGRRGENYRD